jgi:hypothetical protein
MKTFLMIVGGVVIGGVLLLVIAGVAIWLYVRMKLGSLKGMLEKFADQMKMAGAVPPFRIELEPAAPGTWSNDKVEAISSVLEERGFVRAGDFRVDPIPAGLHVRLLANEDQGVQAAIYEHGQAGVWLDLVTRYHDGRVQTTSSVRDHLMDSMPGKTIKFHEGSETDWLVEEHLGKRPVGEWRRVATTELPELFQRVYGEEMDWRGSRGGPTAEEIKRISDRDGGEATPEMIDTIRQAWQMAFHDHRTGQLREAFFGKDSLSTGDDDSWLFVYDGMSVSEVDDAIDEVHDLLGLDRRDAPGDDEDEDERESRFAAELADRVAAVGARAAFAEAVAKCLGTGGFEKTKSIDSPVAADLYRLPESVGDDDDDLDGDE